MSSKIYGKLAITNLKNNRKTYVPYILMAVLSVMMYYIVGGMAQGNNGLSKDVKMIMGYMNRLLMIFSVIFLFYTNSFLIKRRKREIGIYNILGMGKGHIAKMLAIEAVITAFISIFGGILLGIVFGKLMYLVLGKLLHYDISVKFTVEIPVLEKTFAFFMAIFVLILLYNLLQIRIVSPVELLHGSNQGEREPKTKWLLAIVSDFAWNRILHCTNDRKSTGCDDKIFLRSCLRRARNLWSVYCRKYRSPENVKEKQKILLPGKTFYGSIRHGLPHETKRSGARKHLHLKYDGTDYGVHYRLPLCGYE